MKTPLKVLLFVLGFILIIIISLITFYLIMTSNIYLDKDKLVNMERIITYYDKNGNKFSEESGGIAVTNIEKIPSHVKNAFIAIEDKRFYKHKGVDYKGLIRATLNNVKSFSFKEGASTISQQLIKNTHLSNEKTLKRKLSEIKLAKKLEKNYSKDEILEKYLNTIYFGNGCYGITEASKFYFDKTPELLNVNEGALLAGMIKAPTYYSPITNKEKSIKRKNIVLYEMKEQGYITEKDYKQYLAQDIAINSGNSSNSINFSTIARNEFNSLIKNCPYKSKKFNVYTSFSPDLQKILEDEIICSDEYQNSTILLNKYNEIVAFRSTRLPEPRQPGSTLKPLLVYAPAIETDMVYSCTPILDEKTNFNGYTPSNYNDKYYGYLSVKESLSKSLNTCAVKLLNHITINKAKSYLDKTDIKLSDNDNSLCLALGATEKGVSLCDLTSAYGVFLNEGNFYSSSIINKISTENNEIIFSNKKISKQVFTNETVGILNDMLEYTVQNGTAKKLSYTNLPIYAKTGTVGNENGNTDAYTISYTSEYVLGTWCGNCGKELMNNSVSGGTIPAKQSANIWNKVYINHKPTKIQQSENLQEEFIDKISYESNHIIKLADENAPLRYKELALFKKNKLPKARSTEFTSPTIKKPKISVNIYGIEIRLCLTQLYDAIIYKHQNNKKIAVYDTANNNKEVFIDKDVKDNQKYLYSVIPYYRTNEKTFYGKEIYLNSIKYTKQVNDDWWKNELE